MPSINITDQLTLNITAELAPFACWLKYAGELPGIILSGGDLGQLPLLRLSDPAVHCLQPALSFQKPVGLGAGGAQLIIGAEAGGSFQVIPRTLSQTALFPEEQYGEAIEISAGTCYVALGFEATVNAGVTQTSGSLTFGLDTASGLRIDSYRPFSAGPDAITITEALRRSIAEFVIPADGGDLKALPAGVIVAVTGHGSLKFCHRRHQFERQRRSRGTAKCRLVHSSINCDRECGQVRRRPQSRIGGFRRTRIEQFGAPWGLVAMFLASGGSARAEMRIISPRFVFDGEALKDANVQSQAVG